MAYKAVFNGDSLCHFNPNHDPKTGQFTKANKYQYTNGYLTPEGKQRWMNEHYKDLQRAAKNKKDTSNIQTKINTKEWIKQDRKEKIARAAWLGATIGVGGVYIGKRKVKWNEDFVDHLLKEHSGDSVYKLANIVRDDSLKGYSKSEIEKDIDKRFGW